MISVETFTATIYIGTRVGYTDLIHGLDTVRNVCQSFVDRVGLCVTVTPTEFIYTNGGEPGAAIGLIHYPRFPSDPDTIRGTAIDLAGLLMQALGQQRVSVVFPDKTIMFQGDS